LFVVFILSVATVGILSRISSKDAGRILHQDKNAVLKINTVATYAVESG